jgi:hypothetical protein
MRPPRQLEKQTKRPSAADGLLAPESRVSAVLKRLRSAIAAVKRPGEEDSDFDRALAVLQTLAEKEGIPIAIIGGMAAIQHGHPRGTHDIDVVVAKQHLDSIIRVAPQYGIKVIWHAPDGWHKLRYEGVNIEIVPEGGKPSQHAPTTVPSPKQLGVGSGSDYASLEGWVETKISSGRLFDHADVVEVLKRTDPKAIAKTREYLVRIHRKYVRLFDEFVSKAEEEKDQERQRGGPR